MTEEQFPDQESFTGESRGYSSSKFRNLTDFAKEVVRFQLTLAAVPFSLLPSETRQHAGTAMTEGIRAVRSLVDGMAGFAEDAVADVVQEADRLKREMKQD